MLSLSQQISAREAFVNERLNFLVFVGKLPQSLSANVLWHSFHVGLAFRSLVIFISFVLAAQCPVLGVGVDRNSCPHMGPVPGGGEGAEDRVGQMKSGTLHLVCISKKMYSPNTAWDVLVLKLSCLTEVEIELAKLCFSSAPLSSLRVSWGRRRCGYETVPWLEENADALLCHLGY